MTKVKTDENSIRDVFGRFVGATYPSKDEAIKMLGLGKRLRFYYGVDPTGPDIHIGHLANLFVLKRLIGLGHEIVFLIGDFTALIGDPTDKEATRKTLTKKDVKNNLRDYLNQVHKIIPKGSFKVKHNSDWYKSMRTEFFMQKIARKFTAQQLLARDMFQKRIKEGRPITAEEFLYPLFQGYDSVALDVDGEIGGTDQTFNMLIGRDMVKSELNKEKIVLTTKLLEDPKTGKKIMSKSEGRYIALNNSPADIFGKVMAIPDTTIIPLFSYATELPDNKINEVRSRIEKGENPKIFKTELAFEIVKIVYGEARARRSQEDFEKIFSQKELPDNMPEFKPVQGRIDIKSVLLDSKIVNSGLEARRLAEQNGIKVNDQPVGDLRHKVKRNDVIKVGPRRFIKIK